MFKWMLKFKEMFIKEIENLTGEKLVLLRVHLEWSQYS